MCGIVGYIGNKPVIPILLDGLTRLEYRGYDSAGIAWIDNNQIVRIKAEGKIQNLYSRLPKKTETVSHIGIGHTRWATHGEPTENNAHPHCDCHGDLVIVHNGIIENYRNLKEMLIKKGHIFSSDTDTEVIAHLIEENLKISPDFFLALKESLISLHGSFALAAIHKKDPETVFAARKQSPLVLGLGEGENFVASDVPAVLPYTKKVIFLDDNEIAVLKADLFKIFSLNNNDEVIKKTHVINWSSSMAEKGGHKHFMLKEIYEQPSSILNTIRGRVTAEPPGIDLYELSEYQDMIKKISRIVFIACGTSLNAGLVSKYWLGRIAGVPVDVEMASEFKYSPFLGNSETLYIPISQSGETADTLSALRLIKENNGNAISICNVLGSTITRESGATLYTHAGPEIGVAATKTFTAQLTALYILSLYTGMLKGRLNNDALDKKIINLMRISPLIETRLSEIHEQCINIADKLYNYRNFLYLGRNICYPLAMEGALKLKEISYIHAEGYAAGEMKHGPIALIDKDMPVVTICPPDSVYEKMLSNLEEVRSRKGVILAITQEGTDIHLATYKISLPKLDDPDLIPFLYIMPLQLIAYEIAKIRGCDVDQPRNLAKSVTVE
jgi:glucosamine--fructose-6-phosphate aminotransferase (isomerizing)